MPSLEKIGSGTSAANRLDKVVLPLPGRPFTIINVGFPILTIHFPVKYLITSSYSFLSHIILPYLPS
ncbi:hypothetical protein KDH_79240 [Dictyobacter sp. S3.2.2.5]|uniref:Uncharacterized protein n=1 Tax=Dictyobacter halimunensis TaxID=3026934 RepID=A0ABQ6G519_9CHLR|nr:hypothetical protein KDH_79240 [Dictyobacter sp. S3.2.2.5]